MRKETLAIRSNNNNNEIRQADHLFCLENTDGYWEVVEDTVWNKKRNKGYCGTTFGEGQATTTTTNKIFNCLAVEINTVGYL